MSIDKIIIENFKAFEGQHIFDLKALNIFTGPNNSGKSTLIKAMSFFSDGLEKGDFPFIDLFGKNTGKFTNLVNRTSVGNSFKIGFFITVGKIKLPFKVMYEFVDFEYSDKSGIYNSSNSFFLNFEVCDSDDRFLFGVYNKANFVVNKENIEYKVEGKIESKEYPFLTPSEGGDNSMLIIKFNIESLTAYVEQNNYKGYAKLMNHIKSLVQNNENWWLESFLEFEFDYSLESLLLKDLMQDIYEDNYRNIGDLETRFSYSFGGENDDEFWDDYVNLRNELNYLGFIKEVIFPFFQSIESGLILFRKKSFVHINFQDHIERLISKSERSDYLFQAFYNKQKNNSEFDLFVRDSLNHFSIDGYVEFGNHLNTALEVSLVTKLKETEMLLAEVKKKIKINKLKGFDSNIQEEKNTELFNGQSKVDIERIFCQLEIDDLTKNGYKSNNFSSDFKDNPRTNLVDLGKGTANLIGLIIKIYNIIYKYNNENARKIRPSKNNTKLILLEEPEAFLHPDWQSKLADFMVFCINFSKNINVIFVIETHSEYLIRRLQYLIAKTKIESEETIIYYFNSTQSVSDGDAHIKKLLIRKDGIMDDDFGEGFFDESTRLTIDLLKIQSHN